MMLFAQAEIAAKEFHKASESWGLANTVLLSIIVFGMVVMVCIARWLKPKIDDGFRTHMELVATLTSTLPNLASSALRMEAELRHQSGCVDQQTAGIDALVRKIKDWPSDTDKVCRIQQVLKDAGVDEKTIKRIIEAKQRRGELP